MYEHLTFNSFDYLLCFLPIVYVGYRVLRRTRFVNIWLCLSSLFFYGTSGLYYLIPLLFTCIFDYCIGKEIVPENKSSHRRLLFITSVIIQIGLLSTFKYLGWLTSEAEIVLGWLGLSVSLPALSFLLPPGISFYTFHTISYTSDIYRGRFKPHNRLIDYITFVCFFPQLVAGPIARASDLLPQVAAKRPLIDWSQWESALWLIAWGLLKKITLADNFANLVGLCEVNIRSTSPSPGAGMFFAYCFAGQIYCDFSAYTDIARGSARLFNIELTRNFRTPYFAASPSEFWQRWHISLSTWLRDYLYIPLGGDREGRLNTLRNLTITMFLGGLWHGAGVGFIGWGLYHGALLVIYRIGEIEKRLLRLLGPLIGKLVSIVLLFQLICIGWIFFRATAGEILPAFSSIGQLFIGHFPDREFLVDIGWGLILYGGPLVATEFVSYRRGVEFSDLYQHWRWWGKAVAYVIMFYAIVFFGARQHNEFIYFQF